MFFRIIKFALQNFYRNFWLSLVTITILVVTLLSVTTLIVLNVVLDQAVKSVEEKIDISLYLDKDIDDSKIFEIKNRITKIEGVKKVDFISKEEALLLFKKKYQDNPLIVSSLDMLEDNPLNDVLTVKAYKPEDYQGIISKIEQEDYNKYIEKKDFDDHRLIIGRIVSIKNKIREMGLIVIVIFSFIAALIVFNTVRMAIYTHRQEITIMRLVGATNWFIRAPFLFEEVFYAFLGCLLLIAVFFPLLDFLEPYLGYFLGYNFDLIAYFRDNFVFIFGLQFLGAALINILSSLLAMKRYLKV